MARLIVTIAHQKDMGVMIRLDYAIIKYACSMFKLLANWDSLRLCHRIQIK